MKYLKYFEEVSAYEAYKNGSDYVLPNVSYVVETKDVKYDSKKSFKLRAKYNATPDNLVAFTGATNIASLKVNGNSIKIEPIKNENTTFDVLGENISLDMKTGAASFPESYLIKSPVSSWSFKAKDPNYVINENTYVCMLGMMDGMTLTQPIPWAEAMSYGFTTNDGVTLELVDEFLTEINMQIENLPIGFTLMDMDMNSQTFVFIDTEHQANVTTGGLSNYSFDSEGSYDVEIELADPVMKDITFAETPLISIEIGDGITSIGDEAFGYCSSLTSVVIPDSVTSIGVGAFDSCSELTNVTLGNSITSIGDEAFFGCSGLTSIVIPDSVTTIENGVFGGCSGLTSITIPDSVSTIGYEAFRNCSSLTSVVIPDSVTSIGEGAFRNCSGLTSVNIGSGVTRIDARVFQTCSSLTSVVIPDSVTSIGQYAFYQCGELTSVTIGSGVTTIGYDAFSNCSGLTSVNIGSGVTSICGNAFFNCSSLTSITIPDSVTSIGYDAFRYSGLTEVTIGSGVTSIDRNAFYYCSSLTSITCLAPTAPTIYSYTFCGVKNDGVLKVPEGSDYSAWMSTSNYYLGYHNWTVEYFIPENAKIFEITYDVEENARQTEELFNLIYTNLGEENIKNNAYANTSVSVKEATGYDYISYSNEYSENGIFFFEIIEIDAYDDMISINFGHNVCSYHFSDNSYETKEIPV